MATVTISGTRVLVLGGSGILGSAIAAELRGRGASVILAGRNRETLQRRATELGADVPSVMFDLGRADHAEHVVSTAVDRLGGLDGLVNAAGVVAFGALADTTDAVIDQLVSADLVGPLRVIRAALPHLEHGFVVNLTGVVAEQPTAGMAVYSAVKAGLSSATKALGRELRRKHIHFLDARPPHTETGLASRPVGGSAPPMPPGLSPGFVAATVIDGLAAGRRELPASAFRTASR